MTPQGYREPFAYSINTSTLKGSLVDKIKIAAEAGYQGIEPWAGELDEYVKAGGNLDDIRTMIDNAGMSVVNVIAFFEWAVDDEARRQAGFAEARRVMEMAWKVGCDRLAAPPSGLVDAPGLNVVHAARCYRQLIELGSEYGVLPMVEFWGVSRALGRLSEAAAVLIESGSPSACLLIDIFHMYKRGSPFDGLRMIHGEAIGLVHMNDYPKVPARDVAKDSDRVFPGDGIAPIPEILYDLWETGYRGALSLELFNESYYAQDQLTVAKTGLAKMKQAVAVAMARAAGQ